MENVSNHRSRLFTEYIIAVLLAGIVYYISVAPGVLWQDSGLAQIRVITYDFTGKLGLALAHPLYYLIAQLFQFLPFKDSAFKTNLVSVTFGTFTVANVYLLLSLLLTNVSYRRFAAGLGAVSLGLAHTFWQHCALAEVYSVSTFFVTCELIVIAKFVLTKNIKWYLLAWFLNGLECSNHMLATITLAAIIVWTISLTRTEGFKLRWLFPAAALWIIGAIPYEYLGLQAWLAGQPISDVIHSMLFGRYQKQVLNTTVSLKMLIASFAVICLNFPTPNILLIPAGMIKARRIIKPTMFNLLIIATIFHLLFAVRYSVRDQYTFFILPVLFLSLWIGLGSAWLISRKPKMKFVLIAFALIPPLFYAILPDVIERYKPSIGTAPIPYRNEAKYFFQPWKTRYVGPQKLAEEVFKIAPKNSIIIADGTSSRPLIYYQLAYNKRNDLTITNSLFANEPDGVKIRKLKRLLKSRAVFVIRPYPHYCPDWILKNFKLSKVNKICEIKE